MSARVFLFLLMGIFVVFSLQGVLGIDVTNCTTLDIEGGQYFLQNNVGNASASVCFQVTADSITLNLNGYVVEGFRITNAGVTIENRQNITIMNGTFSNFTGVGLNVATLSNSFFKDLIFSSVGTYGTQAYKNVNNSFINLTFSGSDEYDFSLSGDSANNTLENINFSKGGIGSLSDSSGSSFLNYLSYSNSFAKIDWIKDSFLQDLSLTNSLLFGQHIVISDNSAYLNSTHFAGEGINSSANVTLYGIGERGYINPVILKDGVDCDDCWNFTALNASTVIFNVSSWSNYSIGESKLLTGCQNITSPGIYTLMNDVQSDIRTCFDIQANNVGLDLNGYNVNRSAPDDGDNYAVRMDGHNGSIIKNGNFSNFYLAVLLQGGVMNSLIENNTFVDCGYAIDFGFSGGNYNNTLLNHQAFKTNPLSSINAIHDSSEDGVGEFNYLVYNNSFGEIRWTNVSFLSYLDLSASITFPGTINISNNSVYLNSTHFAGEGINSSANVTLYGIGDRGFSNPTILKDGVECTDCYNFTALNASTVVFNVSSWSEYSIGEGSTGDSTFPLITILSPISQNHSSSGMDFNISSNEDLSYCVVSLDAFASNYSLSLNDSLTGGNYTNVSIADGTYTAVFWCNDTSGNVNDSESVVFGVDSTLPVVSIVIPANNTNSTNNALSVNYTVSDSWLDSCWYSNDTYSSNTSLTSCANITAITWAEGNHNVTIWANDSAGNEASDSVSFFIDSLAPEISVVAPLNITYNDSMLYFNISSNEALDSCLFSINDWVTNYIFSLNSSLTGGVYELTGISNGDYIANFSCNDSFGNLNASESVNFTINDTTSPLVTISSPTATTYTTNSYSINIVLNEPGYCVYSLNSGSTNSSLSTSDNLTFTGSVSSVANGAYVFMAYCNDSNGNKNYTENVSFSISVTTTPPSSCFLAGTKIFGLFGEKDIEDVEVGDYVYSYDVENGVGEYKQVSKTFVHNNVKEYLVINNQLRVTLEHPMFIDGSWKQAKEVKIGDVLMGLNGIIIVKSIDLVEGIVDVYNLEVEGYHTYFADNILVHNKGGGCIPTSVCPSASEICVGSSCSNGCTTITGTKDCSNVCTPNCPIGYVGSDGCGGICSGVCTPNCPEGYDGSDGCGGMCDSGDDDDEDDEPVLGWTDSGGGVFSSNKINLTDDLNCTSDWECEAEWEDIKCFSEYSSQKLIYDLPLDGEKRRVCVDKNGCNANKIERKFCSVKANVVIDKKEWCGSEYYEIRDLGGNILARLKGEKGVPYLDVSFTLFGESGCCPYCYDGIKNYDEEGVDTGGSCSGCKIQMNNSLIKRESLVFFIGALIFSFLVFSSLVFYLSKNFIKEFLDISQDLIRKYKFWRKKGYDVHVLDNLIK